MFGNGYTLTACLSSGSQSFTLVIGFAMSLQTASLSQQVRTTNTSCHFMVSFIHSIDASYVPRPCSAKEFQKFILFLRSSPGEAYCLLWLQLERLKFMDTSAQQKQLVAQIKDLFLINGAPFQLELTLRKDILFASCEASNLKEEVGNLLKWQDNLLSLLKTYWYEQYLVIQSAMTAAEKKNEADVDGDSSSETEDDMNELLQVGTVVDHGDEIVEISVSGQELERKLLSDETGSGKTRDKTSAKDNKREKIEPVISKSTQKLFPASVQGGVKTNTDQKQEGLKLLPFIQASIRSNFSAGNPMMHFFSRMREEERIKARNLLLFWESTELILTRDEMKRWYNGISRMSTDDLPCPYLNLFSSYPLAEDLESLLELYIDDNSDFFVDLPSEMQRQLHILLPKGLGHSLLLEVQDYTCKVGHAICTIIQYTTWITCKNCMHVIYFIAYRNLRRIGSDI